MKIRTFEIQAKGRAQWDHQYGVIYAIEMLFRKKNLIGLSLSFCAAFFTYPYIYYRKPNARSAKDKISAQLKRAILAGDSKVFLGHA